MKQTYTPPVLPPPTWSLGVWGILLSVFGWWDENIRILFFPKKLKKLNFKNS